MLLVTGASCRPFASPFWGPLLGAQRLPACSRAPLTTVHVCSGLDSIVVTVHTLQVINI
jgi:hypothetical protein